MGHDDERRLELLVEVDDQLVEERGSHRVETGVGLVEQHDLGIEDESPSETGPLLHSSGDLAGQLLLGPCRPTISSFSSTMSRISFSLLLRVLAKREGDVVVDVHRSEESPVLEQHAELAADLVELFLAQGGDVLVVDPDLAVIGLEQSDQVLQEHRFTRSRRAQHQGDLALGDVEGDVFEDGLGAERLRELADADLGLMFSGAAPGVLGHAVVA